MAGLRTSPRSFVKRYGKETEKLAQLEGGLSGRPSPEAIHDLRVTARRVQMMRRLLPKEIRKSGASRKFDLALRTLLKGTSQIRDLDTLAMTLEHEKALLPAQFLRSLDERRNVVAASARTAARLLSKASVPVVNPLQVKGKRLSGRLRKRIDKRGQVVEALLRKVLRDESSARELHSLRMEVKKLRYLLELADESPPELSVLTGWQDALGAIHDLDVAISYLQEGRWKFAKGKALDELRQSRHSGYLQFTRTCKTDLVRTLWSGDISVAGPIS